MNKNLYSPLIFELSQAGRCGASVPSYTYAEAAGKHLPDSLTRRAPLELPQVDELTVVRHYTNSSNNNFGVDTGFYPLGSCTMKYNPKINEAMVGRAGIAPLHHHSNQIYQGNNL